MLRIFIIFFLYLFSAEFIFAQEGLVKSYYGKNDSLKSEINYSKNIREGAAKFYYPNGNIKEELTYVNGKVQGTVKTYYSTGKLKEMFNVENGTRDGPASVFDSSGNFLKDISYSNGMLKLKKNPAENASVEIASAPAVEKNGRNMTPDKIVTLKNKAVSKPVPPSEDENSIGTDPAYFLTAEVMPEPVGGMKTILNKLVYPEAAKKKGIQGKVEVRAFIDQYGEVTSDEIVKGIGYGCDIAAKIAVYYTKFTPGLIKGKPVKVQMVIPVEFQLKSKK